MRGFNHGLVTPCSDVLSAPPKGPAGGDLTGQYPDPRLGTTGVVEGTYTDAAVTVRSDGRIQSIASGPQRLPYIEAFLRIRNNVEVPTDAVLNFDHPVTHGSISYEDGFVTILEPGDYQITVAVIDAVTGQPARVELMRDKREGYLMIGAGFVTLPLQARDRVYFVNRGQVATFTKPTNTNTTYASVRRVR